ncbi:MAG: DNA-protecting protein DprA [Firmicutes bacterium]|nr:DNA-protecting protein DprA [Bacillota bacterium]
MGTETQLSDTQLKYWNGLNLINGMGSARFRRLLARFGSAEAAWKAPGTAWREVPGIGEGLAGAMASARNSLDLDAELDRVVRSGARVLTWDSPEYPSNLVAIPDSPPVLYLKGDLRDVDRLAVALVGSRRPSAAGVVMAVRLAEELVAAGFTVVSGLARGIDSAAHRGARDASGRTLAVLGCGIDLVYPPENRGLAGRVAAGGALLSEFACGARPVKRNFPARNRLIAGLSLGTVVVEAGEQSGALITAGFAAEYGREVFAVPGEVSRATARGCNHLIKSGAKLVEDVNDIVAELGPLMGWVAGAREWSAPKAELPLDAATTGRDGVTQNHGGVTSLDTGGRRSDKTCSPVVPGSRKTKKPKELRPASIPAQSEPELAILRLLEEGPCHLDRIIRETRLSAALVGATLTALELEGRLARLPGKLYCSSASGRLQSLLELI